MMTRILDAIASINPYRTIRQLREELEAVRIATEPGLNSLRMENGMVEMEIAGAMVENLALALASYCQAAKNYVEITLHSREEPFETFTVTVQKRSGKSPHELRLLAEHERDAALMSAEKAHARIAELERRPDGFDFGK